MIITIFTVLTWFKRSSYEATEPCPRQARWEAASLGDMPAGFLSR